MIGIGMVSTIGCFLLLGSVAVWGFDVSVVWVIRVCSVPSLVLFGVVLVLGLMVWLSRLSRLLSS